MDTLGSVGVIFDKGDTISYILVAFRYTDFPSANWSTLNRKNLFLLKVSIPKGNKRSLCKGYSKRKGEQILFF